MYHFDPVTDTQDLSDLIALNKEYLDWACKELKQEYNIEFIPFDDSYTDTLKEYAISSANNYIKFNPPEGTFYLIRKQGTKNAIGMGGLQSISPGIGEIKRMYVKPEYRGQKLGKKIFEQLLADAKNFGFSTLRLDSTGFMKTAQYIYSSYGFKEIAPYPESEIPDEYKPFWVFMEMSLS